MLLVARLIIGGIFIAAGWMKIGSHDAIAMTVGFFAQLGLPAFMAYVVGYLEVICGAMMLLGVFACKAEGVLAIIMAFAVYFSAPMGIQAYMAPLAILAGLLALVAAGDGRFVALKKGSSMGM